MKTGIYQKLHGHTGVGKLYLLLLHTRDHHTGAEGVVYVPLRIEPQWAGTVRPCWISRAEFEQKFKYIGEGLPKELGPLGDPIPDGQ